MSADESSSNQSVAGEQGTDVSFSTVAKATLNAGASWSSYRDHIHEHVDAFLARRRDVMSSSAAGSSIWE